MNLLYGLRYTINPVSQLSYAHWTIYRTVEVLFVFDFSNYFSKIFKLFMVQKIIHGPALVPNQLIL
jgi:hypothetical protein